VPDNPYRLPRTVVPSRYELTLEPDLGAATFGGTVATTVEITEAVDEVVLNAIELDLDQAWVVEGADGARVDATVTLDDSTERATLSLARPVGPGAATVHVVFRGTLNDKLHGFYRSTFRDDDGTEHVIATTQFEATDARRAFPCWDEPDFKATFAVTLVVAEGLTAVSNAECVADEPTADGRRSVRFADTMAMSTYLVAFVVGPLEVTEPVDVDGTPLRVVHLPGKGHLTGFALESGAFALRTFSEYFGLGYPGGKLDLVAIPDFAFGAMENLGCVTFRETLLLIDPERSTRAELQRVADVIHHEIAHMWFGDLVTMRWWNGIWLNEAFATFMEMRCTDAFRPEWDRWTDFGITRTAAFDTDALATTRPIEFDVTSPEDAEGMFDVLTYEKGAAVVRMLEQYLGEDRFRDGIRKYMVDHQYSNTETTDLWDAIETASGEPVRRIMDSWIFQGGHPVVGVELTDGGATVRLTQEPQRYAGADGGAAGDARRWSVPVLVRAGAAGSAADGGGETSAAALTKVLLEGDSTSVELDAPAEWVVVNSGGSGFFRVRYSPAALTALTGRATLELTPLERYGLVDDAWASVLAGATRVDTYLELLRAAAAEEADLSVWQRITGSLAALDRIVADDDRPRFAAFVRALVAPALHRLGEPAPGEPDRTAALRGNLFAALGELGADESIRERARELHRQGAADPGSVDPDLFDGALRVVASAGDATTFDDFLDRSKRAATPQETLRYLGALADLPDADLVDRFLALTLTDDVRTQDAPYLLRRAIASREHGPRAWAFVHRNWDTVTGRFPSNSIPRLLDGVRTLTDPTVAAGVEAFLAEHPVPQGAKTVAQHIERMKVNVALAQREGAALADALP